MNAPLRAGLSAVLVYLFSAAVTAMAFGGFLWALASLALDADRLAVIAAGIGALLGLIAPMPIALSVWCVERRGLAADADPAEPVAPPSRDA